MNDVLLELLETNDFNYVLNDFDLAKYELLRVIHKAIFCNDSQFSNEEKCILRQLYLDNYSIVDLEEVTVCFISDTHLASKYENLDYLKTVFDFCKENDIQYIFHGGDIGDGMVDQGKRYFNTERQIEHILESFLDSSDIKQYILGGNHDAKYKKRDIDLLRLLASEKKNVIPMGYQQAYFTLCGIPISFEHHSQIRPQYRMVDYLFTIMGHAHKSRFSDRMVKLPALCDQSFYDVVEAIPGFAVMKSQRYYEMVNLEFERYSFSDGVHKEKAYVYELKNKK